MTKRVVIAGSRHYSDYEFFRQKVDLSLSRIRNEYNLIILSGHCSGVDLMAERYAEDNGFQVEIYPAEWSRYGRGAGPKRNKAMIDNADYAIAFSSGGKGTKSLIELAHKKGIPIKIYNI